MKIHPSLDHLSLIDVSQSIFPLESTFLLENKVATVMVILLLEVEVGVDPPFRILFPRSKRNINSSVPWCVNAETITPATERGWNFIRPAEVRRHLVGNIEDERPLGILIGCASLRRFRASKFTEGETFVSRFAFFESKAKERKEKMESLEILK